MNYLKYFESNNFSIDKDLFCKLDRNDDIFINIRKRVIPASEDISNRLGLREAYMGKTLMILDRGPVFFKPNGFYMINPINIKKFGVGYRNRDWCPKGYWVIIPLIDEYFLLCKVQDEERGWETYSDGMEIWGSAIRESKIYLSEIHYVDGYDGVKNAIKTLSELD